LLLQTTLYMLRPGRTYRQVRSWKENKNFTIVVQVDPDHSIISRVMNDGVDTVLLASSGTIMFHVLPNHFSEPGMPSRRYGCCSPPARARECSVLISYHQSISRGMPNAFDVKFTANLPWNLVGDNLGMDIVWILLLLLLSVSL
jgi:hypothetical protein